MREIRTYGSEGGEGESPSLPLSVRSIVRSTRIQALRVGLQPGFQPALQRRCWCIHEHFGRRRVSGR